MTYDVVTTLVSQAQNAAYGLMITGGVWFLSYPIKRFIKAIKEKVKVIDEMHAELTLQRVNCLTTLQAQGDTQIVVLKEIALVLKETGKTQSEMYGYMKGQS